MDGLFRSSGVAVLDGSWGWGIYLLIRSKPDGRILGFWPMIGPWWEVFEFLAMMSLNDAIRAG